MHDPYPSFRTIGTSVRTARSALAGTALVVLIITCSACGGAGSTSPPPPARTTASTSAGSGASSPVDDAQPDITGHGIMAISCSVSGSAATLTLRSATSGTILASEVVPLSSSSAQLGSLTVGQNPCSSPRTGSWRLLYREQFNRDFTAVTLQSSAQSDGSTHVGYLTFGRNGDHFTDVTALTTSKSGGFSSTPPTDSSPVFDPTTGDFYFVRTVQTGSGTSAGAMCTVHRFDPVSQQSTVIGNSSDCSGAIGTSITGGAPAFGAAITLQSGVVVVGEGEATPGAGDTFQVNPAGTLAADRDDPGPQLSDGSYTGNSVDLESVDGQIVNSFQADGAGGLSQPQSFHGVIFMVDGQPAAPTVWAWAGNSSVLASVTNNSNFYLVPVRPGATGIVSAQTLLPSNTNSNSDAVVSPDNSSMAFLSTQGSDVTLYTCPLTSGAAPTQIATGFSGNIIDWQ
jgi:hypothetical protein